jgi:outer membrane immunogenic protein
MRRVFLSTVSLMALSVVGAQAADLPRAAPAYKGPVAVPLYNWTGGYIGINGGYVWGQSDWGLLGGDAKPNGGTIGLTLGYNWQGLGSPWVFGIEGDINWADINGAFLNVACPLGCSIKSDWFGTVRGRIGYAFDRVMPYVTGGFAYGNVKANINGIGTTSDTNFGWTLGAGLEGAIAPNWTAKIEYLYMDLGNTDCGPIFCGALVREIDFTAQVVRAGLNYKF